MTCEKKYYVNTQCHGESSYTVSYNRNNDEMMKWWPKYAERNIQWLNITFIFIMFQNKISYSVSISCLSSFSHLMEDTEKIIFIKEEISLKIKKNNLYKKV